MSQKTDETRSVVVEKLFPYPPEKLWQALTEPALLAQWLLKNDFEPVSGRQFQLRSDPVQNWDGVIDCKVLVVDPPVRLSYSWQTFGHESTVLFTLTPTNGGTHLRMEHSGFSADQNAAYQGATYGWQRFIGNLEQLLSGNLR